MISIEGEAARLCRKYNTCDPFRLARELDIIVLYEELGSIRGYYNKCYKQKFIHINSALPEDEALSTCAHELAHAVLHSNLNTIFLKEHTLFSISRFENEADSFASDLLLNYLH